MIAWIKAYLHNRKFKYDHTQCVIKKLPLYKGKKPEVIGFYGTKVLLQPGNYSVSCKTPDGYKIKYLKTKDLFFLNIKAFILK